MHLSGLSLLESRSRLYRLVQFRSYLPSSRILRNKLEFPPEMNGGSCIGLVPQKREQEVTHERVFQFDQLPWSATSIGNSRQSLTCVHSFPFERSVPFPYFYALA
jgi:hypothetical protein